MSAEDNLQYQSNVVEIDDLLFDAQFEEEDYRAMGIAPEEPTVAKPGSEAKVLMLAARYAAGLPLWHHEDCYDHGPGRRNELEADGDESFDLDLLAEIEEEEEEEEE